METNNLFGLFTRIREIAIGTISEFEPQKKTLPECLIDLGYEYSRRDCERSLELIKQVELDCKLLVREIKQTMAKEKYSK